MFSLPTAFSPPPPPPSRKLLFVVIQLRYDPIAQKLLKPYMSKGSTPL